MRVLYHSALHPQCRKIRLILDELHVPYSNQEVNIWSEPERLNAIHVTGEAPALVEEDGSVIVGNYAITEYLHEQSRDEILFGESMMERAEIRRLVNWFDTRFDQEVTQSLVYEKVFKRLSRSGSPDTRALRTGKQNLLTHLEYVSALTAENPWLAGERMTIADLAAGAHISAIDFIGDIDWNQLDGAKQWYSLLKSRPSFQKLFRDEIRGITPPPYYDNPDF